MKKLIIFAVSILLPLTGECVSTITKDVGTDTGNLTQSYIIPGSGVQITVGATGIQFPYTSGIFKFNGSGYPVVAVAGTDYLLPSGPFPWSGVTGTPTTLAGYGITDALSISAASATYMPLAGGTFTGAVAMGTQNIGGTNWFIRGDTGKIAFDTAHITSDGSGNLTAVSFIGAGSALTSLPASTALYPILNQNTTGTASNVTSIVSVIHGGTGTATPSLISGTNVTITGTWPNQTVSASGSSGSGGTVTTFSSGNLTPLFTTSVSNASSTPALSFSLSATSQNAFLAGPTSGSGSPSYRGIVVGDVPTLNQNTTGNAGTVTGLSVVTGKTLTASNSITIAGTDGSTINVGSGGTLGSAAFTSASAYEVPLTFSTGLTRTVNTVTVNTSQNIATLSNLTSNGFVKTSGGVGTLSVDTNTYITGNQTITVSGDASGSGTTSIPLVVTKSNGTAFGSAAFSSSSAFAPATTGSSILYANGTGGFSSVSIGTNLSFSAGTLSASGGSGGGSGTVTSVGLSFPSVLGTVSSSPVTTAGTLTVSAASVSAGYFIGSPAGTSGTIVSRALTSADIPSLPYGTGSVTSVSVSGGSYIGVSGSPITGSGTISLSLSSAVTTQGNVFNGASQLVKSDSNGYVSIGSGSWSMSSASGGGLTLNNGTSDSPPFIFYQANNSNFAWDVSGGNFRIIKNKNESGGSVLFFIQNTGNAAFTGTVAATQFNSSVFTSGSITKFDSSGNIVAASAGTDYLLPSGSGASLTSLNASSISSGTLSDSRLSSNVPLLNALNNFSVKQKISASGTTASQFDIGTLFFQDYGLNNAWFGENVFYNGSGFVYNQTGYGGIFYFAPSGEGQFRMFPSGSAGSSTPADHVTLKTDNDGSFAVGVMTESAGNFSGYTFQVDNSGNGLFTGNISTGTAGKSISIKSGANALAGTVTLSSGTATITSSAIDANTVIILTQKTAGGTAGTYEPRVSVSSGSAQVTGLATDTSTYNWIGLKVN